MDLHGLAALEAHPEILDQLAVVAQGLRGVHDALGLAAHRGGEALLAGDVGVEGDALQAGIGAAEEHPLGDHAHGEVGAVVALVVQLPDAQAVEIGAALGQIPVVGFPRGQRIVVHAGGEEDRLPQLFDGPAFRQLREELLGPGRAGYGGDAPLVLVLHLVPVGLDDRVSLPVGLGHFGLVDALQPVRILGIQEDAAGQRVHIVLQARLLPFLDLRQRRHGLVPDVQLFQRLVGKFHLDLSRAGLVALVHQQRNELRLVELGKDQHVLPFLNVDAGAGDQARVLA